MDSFETLVYLFRDFIQDQMKYEKYGLDDTLPAYSSPQKVYRTLFKWISDPINSPGDILHLLNIYTNGFYGVELNSQHQDLVSFTCLEALAQRGPQVLIGKLEEVVYIMVKWFQNTYAVWDKLKKKVKPETLKWLTQVSSPKLCPNPCLRLELFRVKMSFCSIPNIKKFYDQNLCSEYVISTICELKTKYSSLTVHQLPSCRANDMRRILSENFIDMENIMQRNYSDSKRIMIITAMVKLGGMFACLEKDRYRGQKLLNELRYNCLTFFGLDPENYNEDSRLINFIKSLGNTHLLDTLIDAYFAIHNASLSFLYDPDDVSSLMNEDELVFRHSVIERKNKTLNIFFKHYVGQLPMHLHLREMNECKTLMTEFHINNLSYIHQDSALSIFNNKEDNPECNVSINSGHLYGNSSTVNDSDYYESIISVSSDGDDSENNDTDGNDSNGFVSSVDFDSDDNDSDDNDSDDKDSDGNATDDILSCTDIDTDSDENDSDDNDSDDKDSDGNTPDDILSCSDIPVYNGTELCDHEDDELQVECVEADDTCIYLTS